MKGKIVVNPVRIAMQKGVIRAIPIVGSVVATANLLMNMNAKKERERWSLWRMQSIEGEVTEPFEDWYEKNYGIKPRIKGLWRR